MPRGEPSYSMPGSGSTFTGSKTYVGSTNAPAPARASGVTGTGRFTDPTANKRYGGRGGSLFNPALLRSRKGKSLIGTRIDKNLVSLIGAFDPLEIST